MLESIHRCINRRGLYVLYMYMYMYNEESDENGIEVRRQITICM